MRTKNENFVKNRNFCAKSKFLSKIKIFLTNPNLGFFCVEELDQISPMFCQDFCNSYAKMWSKNGLGNRGTDIVSLSQGRI